MRAWSLSVLAGLSGAGCYQAMAPLTTPASQLAWVERLGGGRLPTQLATTCPESLDEPAVIALALARNPEIAALEGEAGWLEASAEASLAAPPQLRLNGLRLDEVAAAAPRFTVGLRVPFDKPGTLAAQADALHQEALAVRARAEEEARKVTLDLRLALVRHHGWKALARVALAERTLSQAEFGRLEQGARQRQVALTDVASAELALLEADGNVARAEGEAARWRSVLGAAIGACALADENPDGWTLAADGLGDREALVTTALSERPSVKRYAALSGMASAKVWQAKAMAWPWFDWIQVGYEVTQPVAADTWVFSLAIDLPISNWDGAHAQAAEAEARAVLEAARRDVALIVAEVDAALLEWRACDDAIVTLARMRIGFDEPRLAALEKAAREGTADPADVFKVKRDLGRLERRRVEGLIALREARAHLLAAVAK